jgi:hypothetical protein
MGGHLLLKSFEEEEFLVGSPFLFEEWEVEFIDDSILLGELLEIGEAGAAVVGVLDHHLRGLGDVTLALVALDLVGRVQDVLSSPPLT